MESKNAPQRVVGLAYEADKGLPRVILKGSGPQVEKIVDEGRRIENRIPVVQDRKLLEVLYRLPTDAEIGPELFGLVATLLAHIYAVDAKMKERKL